MSLQRVLAQKVTIKEGTLQQLKRTIICWNNFDRTIWAKNNWNTA